MKRTLNTLFVTTQNTYLAKDGETVAVKKDRQTLLRAPIHTLGGIVCFGQVSCSPFLMAFCAEQGVSVSFLTENGRYLAGVSGPVSGNVLLRREQFRWADDPGQSARMAGFFITGKIANCRTVLQRAARDHPQSLDGEAIGQVCQRLTHHLESLDRTPPLEEMRGMEGDAARAYFSVFGQLILSQARDFPFDGRNRRPPLDPVNCLLSFVYTILMHDVRGALLTHGLDPAVGFLHRDRPGRYGLALDMMEEFRPFLADRLVFSLINLSQVKAKGFEKTPSGAVHMDEETRKTVLVAYQKRKQDEITHPFLGEKCSLGMLFHIQALLLARCIRGDLDGYPPFIWK